MQPDVSFHTSYYANLSNCLPNLLTRQSLVLWPTYLVLTHNFFFPHLILLRLELLGLAHRIQFLLSFLFALVLRISSSGLERGQGVAGIRNNQLQTIDKERGEGAYTEFSFRNHHTPRLKFAS